MPDKKLYYWIKLKTDFFDSDTIDFLMSQKNGADYVVLYQMLCLKTANNNGELYSQIGELIVPFDVEKIVRITKYFSADTVRVALELYKNLGLVYVQENEILRIANFSDLIGCETQWAEKKRLYRDKKKNVDKMEDKSIDKVEDIVREEIRDKSIEYRYIENKENTAEAVKEKEKENQPSLSLKIKLKNKTCYISDADLKDFEKLYNGTVDVRSEAISCCAYYDEHQCSATSWQVALTKWISRSKLYRQIDTASAAENRRDNRRPQLEDKIIEGEDAGL